MNTGTDSIHVLHVDDDKEFAELTAAFLSCEDGAFEITTVTSAEQALDRVGDGEFDCVVSDYDMPGRNGIELLETVRRTRPDLPFVLFTAKGSEEIASRAISAGVTGYLQKGTSNEQYTILANRIENAVSRCESDRELRQWKQAIETATEGVAIVGPRGRYLQMNAAYADVYDASRDDLVGTDWRERYDDDEVTRFEDDVLPLLRRDGTWSGEAVGRRADGTPVDESLSLSLLEDGGHVCILRDVTELKRRERELERYERIVETVGEGVYVLDDDLRFIFVNRAMTVLTGLEREELLGSSLSRIVDTETTGAGREARESLLRADREVETVEAELRTIDDDPVYCEFRFTVFPSGAGVHTVGTVRDVTARTTYESELETVRDRMEFALEATDSVIYDVDIDTGNQTRHGPFDRLYGLPSTAVPTSEAFYDRAIHPDDRDTVEGVRREFLTTANERVEYEYRTHPDAGTVRWIRSEAHVHTGPTGDPQKLVGLATDITPLKRRERELERRNERLDEFVSVASHDLRNPLSVAMGALELARDDCDSEQLDTVSRAHDRMATLVEDLLALARGRAALDETEPVDLAALAEQAWRTVETENATLVTDAHRPVRAEEGRLRQLLENLLANAVEHGPAEDRSRTDVDERPDDESDVTVTVGELDDGFYVEDDGRGIPPDKRERVFEEGYTTRDDGTGFGLSIVREVADVHGWDVAVTDGTDGGARFGFTGVEQEA